MKMVRGIGVFFILAISFAGVGRAVETGSSYVTTTPTVSGWDTGWTQPVGEPEGTYVTGWNYVGQVNGASGVYLGDGYVLTAAHVGVSNFVLDGVTYDYVSGSAEEIGTSDLTIFRISSSPDLPALTLALNAPTPFSNTSQGDEAVMIGYGGGHGETWAADTVLAVNYPITPTGSSYVSSDFLTLTGTYESDNGLRFTTSHGQLVVGDSGGGDFIYDPTTDEWELAGINEVQLYDTNNDLVGSGMVQISQYAGAIQAAMAPEPASWLLLGLGIVAICWMRRVGMKRA